MQPYELYVLIALVVAEMALLGFWAPAYFRYGIPIFRVRVPALTGLPPGTEERLETEFSGGSATQPLLFRQLSASEIAFRESLQGPAWFRYAPIKVAELLAAPAAVTGFSS